MKNILIISNDSRIPSLVDFFQPLIRGQVHSVTDFDLGLKEVFDKRPVAVFIQSEIAGISGDAVAKHIKGLLRDDSPRLVLLRDAPDKPLASRHAFDDSIDLFLSLEEVARLMRSQLEKVAGLELQDIPPAPNVQESAASEPEGETGVDTSAVPMESAPAAAPQRPAPKAAAPPAAGRGRRPDAPGEPQPPRSEALASAPVQEPASAPGAGSGAHLQEPIVVETPIVMEGGGKTRPTTSRTWLFLCVLLALLLGGAFVFAPRWSGQKQKPSAPVGQPKPAPPVPPSSVPAARPLPSIVPLNGRDAAYAAARPGWERYLSTTLEFLVFREQGGVKAIQVIGRDGGTVPDQTVNALLRESFQSERFTPKGSKDQDGYAVEEGAVPGKGEVLIYRKKETGSVRAVVITWQ